LHDSALEETGFEPSVPRKAPVGCSLDNFDWCSLYPATRDLAVCRWRHEAANLGRKQPSEFDRRRILTLRPDDLQAHR
jgi:hypothetical protein